MRYCTVDIESYWSQDHSLSKMSPIIYCTSPKTEIICLAYKWEDQPTEVIFRESNIKEWAAGVNWSDVALIAHNGNGFDFMPLVWRFGIRPRLFADTLCMARPIHAKQAGGSLKALVKHYGLGEKDQTVLLQTRGKYLDDFTKQERADMARYNKADVDQTWELFKILAKVTSPDEMKLIDLTARMLVYPQFEVDTALLERGLAAERKRKHVMLMELAGLLDVPALSDEVAAEEVRKVLMSANKFSALLASRGIEVPTKISKTTGKETPALAKTDEDFTALMEHEDPIVSTAAQARLGVKSTILETRIEAFLNTADAVGGKLPVPLMYYGADTTGRWSGWDYNMQNLSRVDKSRPQLSDVLRMSLKAPPGHEIVVADLSGIELRMNHFLWQVPSSMALFQADPEKADLYKEFASKLYNTPKEQVTKIQRQMGKLCLVEGTVVLTDRGEVPIEQVVSGDKVWDGVEWVSTLGAIYNGEQHVICYDGIEATPDHIVWTEEGLALPLWRTAAQSLRLARTGDRGAPLGFNGIIESGNSAAEGLSLCENEVPFLREGPNGVLRQPSGRQIQAVPPMLKKMWGAGVATTEDGLREATMRQPERQVVQQLRREGDQVPVPVCCGGGCLGDEKPWATQRKGARPDRQQRPLRAGQPALRPTQDQRKQQTELNDVAFCEFQSKAPGSSLCGQHVEEFVEQGADRRTNCGSLEYAFVQTKRRVWDLLECGPRHRFTANGKLVSNCHLGLQYGSGAATFRKVAKAMGGVSLSEPEAAKIVTAWRDAYPEIVQGWATCQTAITHMAHPGAEGFSIDPWCLCHTTKHGIVTPKGRIRYPNLRQEWDEKDQRQTWFYGEGRHKTKIYSSKIVENCIAEGTLVLTDKGWKPIEYVELSDLVHDGVSFVRHGGKAFRSVQHCVNIDGVNMTPDHEVLNDAQEWTPASQFPRPYRPDLRGVDCAAPVPHRRDEMALGVPVPMRSHNHKARTVSYERSQARRYTQLRLSNWTTYWRQKSNSWHEQTPSLLGVAQHGRPLSVANTPILEKLRSTWNIGLRAMARVVRKFLGGYERLLSAWLGLGSGGQQWPILAGELSMGCTPREHHEQAQHYTKCGYSNPSRRDGDCQVYSVLPAEKRTGPYCSSGQAQGYKVYDILNVGPHRRFVVLGESGPFIVHNCVQHLARFVLSDIMLAYAKTPLGRQNPIIHCVHDEIVVMASQADAPAALELLHQLMRQPPTWFPELVTWSEGSLAQRYGAAK